MPANTFGEIFRITTFGESHGKAVGVVIDGCPSGLVLSEEDIQPELDRRKPGQSKITTPRKENDVVEILSGVFEGKTTGAPISLLVWNENQRSQDYDHLKNLIRPGHADFTYNQKYGNRDPRGGGRSSARIMIGRVAGGAVAKKFLKENFGTEFLAYTEQVGEIKALVENENINFENIEKNIVRCPDQNSAEKMIELIEKVRSEKDSIGGAVKGIIKNVPKNLGEPEFDKISAVLAHAMMSINAVKGFEIGLGFGGIDKKGSEYNDIFENVEGKIQTKTNHSGGVLGGVTTGENIDFRVVIKPVATIGKNQKTLNKDGKEIEFEGKGRHDPCVLPRAVPIVEAMSALVIMDMYLRNKVFEN